MATETSESVFPNKIEASRVSTGISFLEGGLSKRELIAAMMAQGMLSNDGGDLDESESQWAKYLAQSAVQAADALIAQLAKGTK